MNPAPHSIESSPGSGEPAIGYTTREVAELLETTPQAVRGWARSGLVKPRRGPGKELRFGFQDLVLLRAARDLVESDVPRARVRRALIKLKEQLPQGRSLAGVRISAEGGRLIVQSGGDAWEPESGQQRLDLEVEGQAEPAAPPTLSTAPRTESSTASRGAEDWYDLGCELELVDLPRARRAYRRALDLDAGHVDAHLNLGRILHEEGRVDEAEAHYRSAVLAGPSNATAAFDLGVALQDLRRSREAVEAYELAIDRDPGYADAHFNLAAIYEELGEQALAIQHLKAYKALRESQARAEA